MTMLAEDPQSPCLKRNRKENSAIKPRNDLLRIVYLVAEKVSLYKIQKMRALF